MASQPVPLIDFDFDFSIFHGHKIEKKKKNHGFKLKITEFKTP